MVLERREVNLLIIQEKYSVQKKDGVTDNIRKMVGAIGFEPTTYGTQNRRATRLRHAPTKALLTAVAAGEKP